jgi:hypothetical protein
VAVFSTPHLENEKLYYSFPGFLLFRLRLLLLLAHAPSRPCVALAGLAEKDAMARFIP